MVNKAQSKKGEKMNLECIRNYESSLKVGDSLLNNDKDISSRNSESRFLTSRISNVILGLRNSGIEIDTKTVKIPGTKKHYGRYVLVQKEENIKKLILLLEQLEVKIS